IPPPTSHGRFPLHSPTDLPLPLQLDRVRRMVITSSSHLFFFGPCRFVGIMFFVMCIRSRFQVLYFAMKALRDGGPTTVYGSVERPLQLARTDCRGHGDSPWHCSFALNQTSGIGLQTRTHILVSSLVISWSITEIIRYSFCGMKEVFSFAPSWLLWLR
ncbi:hypothetical protein B296_00044621, partial [Ensete ventricosum]